MMQMMNMGGGMGGCGGMGGGCGGGMNCAGMMGAPGGASGKDILSSVLQMIPDNVASEQRGFSLRCAIHDQHVPSLQPHLVDIEHTTGVRVQVSKQVSDSAHRAVSITGPLFGVVAAYIRLMRRYLDVE